MKYCLYLYIILCISCSLNEKNAEVKLAVVNESIYRIDVDRAKTVNKILLSSYFKEPEIVILENSKNSLIGSVDKMQIYKDLIIVLDNTAAKSVFLFDMKGNFITRFGNLGSAPSGYTEASYFTINSDNDEIYILDSNLNKINKYKLNGQYISSLSFKDNNVRIYHIQYNEGRLYSDAYFTQEKANNYLLQELDLQTGETKKRWLNPDLYNKGWNNLFVIENNAFFSQMTNSPLFVQQYMDTIMMLKDGDVVPYLTLVGEKMLSNDELRKAIELAPRPELVPMQLMTFDKIHSIKSFFEHDELIYMEYILGNTLVSLLYDKVSNELIVSDIIKDDLLIKENFVGSVTSNWGCATTKGVYCYINPEFVAEFQTLAKTGCLSDKYNKIDMLKNLPEDSNPVILFYEYKD